MNKRFRPSNLLSRPYAPCRCWFRRPSAGKTRQNNVIVRPHHPPGAFLVQFDDLAAGDLEWVRPFAFLIVATSPVNFSGVAGRRCRRSRGPRRDRKDFARRLRKGAGADPSASGATRVAGTANYKRKYEPEFPTLRGA